ncbi:TRP-domain-containing protein [Metschnikowia bicuspidata var. bicuspidata NRRL YB-4993]|uniref:TRP-domain-containing protein n=1 Tax=Metschnikowia bicuspidata var. bicuspidata NRRL YB-4993 TaxID=869754 RepID=A0A1A0HB16_9ASCO|nr:TRP-domain-containing protein [Metschnikowia bicuspidata var. bicuspidata NRRL YB-4993]OBA21319.1 TRP-domain-containing protein [Metschnikowia bicuspidata var. bicuspidata NRRL YB-4993]
MNAVFFLWLALLMPTMAKRSLSATSLVTCMDSSQISPSYFDVTFNPDDRSLKYSLDLVTEISANVTAHVQIYAYGFVIIDKYIDMCDLDWKQFCPIYPGTMQIESIEYISELYVLQIPGIAYSVPDIDAVVKVQVYDRLTGELLSCLQSSFSNGKTVSQTAIKWVTACVAGLGLLIAAVLSTFGNSNAASHISTNAVSLFLYFQSVVVVCMQSVDRVPPIASAWSENLAWSMGLIRVEFMQKIFRWYVQSTGGTPTLYFISSTQQILVQRAQMYLDNLHEYASNNFSISPGIKRSLDYTLSSNANLVVLRGIERIGYNSHIEPTSIVVTGFTFFVLMGFLLAVVIVCVKLAVVLLIRFKKINPNRLSHFRKSFVIILKGALLRYVYIGFTQLVILSLWEFTVQDSPAVIVLACLTLLLALGIIAYALWNTHKFGSRSARDYKNPAAILYGDPVVLHKFGFCYTMFHAQKYWFGMALVSYALLKGIFIGLCQSSGKVSSIVIFIIDLVYMIFLFTQRPYMNKSTNILNYCMAIVITVNSFLFVFFSDLFGQPAQVSSIMGWVFFILNAAFALVLLIMIIVLSLLAILSKNPDARFAPAKDDRTSFQRMSSTKHRRIEKDMSVEARANNELFALGAAAKDHLTDWEDQIYKLHEIQKGSKSESISEINNSTSTSENDDTPQGITNEFDERQAAPTQDKSFGEKLKEKLKFTSPAKPDEAKGDYLLLKRENNTRMSDTMTAGSSLPESPVKRPLKHSRNDSTQSAFSTSNFPSPEPMNTKAFL